MFCYEYNANHALKRFSSYLVLLTGQGIQKKKQHRKRASNNMKYINYPEVFSIPEFLLLSNSFILEDAVRLDTSII